MTVTRLLAQMTVVDFDAAIKWYTNLFGDDEDARPMDGLAEWHLGPTFGVQVWADPVRAGHSTMVIDESDLDALADRLRHAGVDHPGVEDASSSRILRVTDPDGNSIVFTGPFSAKS